MKVSPIQERIDFIINKINKDSKILDIGCGIGLLSKEINKMTGNKIFGIDISLANIMCARKLCKNNKYIQMDAYDIRTLEDKFDVIICSEFLEHLSNPLKFLKIVKNKLAKNGMLLVTIPNGYGLWELFENQPLEILRNSIFKNWIIKIRDKYNLGAKDSINDGCGSKHLHRFTHTKFLRLVELADLGVVGFENLCVFSTILPLRLLREKIPLIYNIDRFLAKVTPKFISSNWGFVLKKKSQGLKSSMIYNKMRKKYIGDKK